MLHVSQLNVKAAPPPVRNKGIDERNRRDQEEQEKLLDPAEVLEAKMQHYKNMGMYFYLLFLTHKECMYYDSRILD
jgi:hypothetical protein